LVASWVWIRQQAVIMASLQMPLPFGVPHVFKSNADRRNCGLGREPILVRGCGGRRQGTL
jgi:hypothetical protein